MSHQIKANYEQNFLLPPSLEDWLSADHPSRYIREFVEGLNLEDLGFKVSSNEEGRPYYSSDLLLKVWLYGYFTKIRSSRQLEKQCKESIALIWLTGMNYPDHNTIWRFWKENKPSIKKVFKESVRIALKLDLVGMVLQALDGTKIKSYSSKRGVQKKSRLKELLKTIDESIEEMEKEVEQNEEIEEGEYKLPEAIQDKKKLKETIKEMLKEFEEVDRDNLNLKETEARIIRNEGGYSLGYNAQTVVDAKNGILVGSDVLNEENDEKCLVPMIENVKQTTELTPELTLADSGYATAEQLSCAEQKGYKVLLNLTTKTNISTSPREDEPYHSSNFKYDEEKDVMICPESKELKYRKTQLSKNKRYEVREYKCENYKNCLVRWQCSKSKTGRRVKLNPYYKLIKRQQEYQQIELNKEKLRRRKTIIEPLFGIIKEAHGFRRFTVKGLENVKAQWSLMCTTINLKRMYGLWKKGKIKLA